MAYVYAEDAKTSLWLSESVDLCSILNRPSTGIGLAAMLSAIVPSYMDGRPVTRHLSTSAALTAYTLPAVTCCGGRQSGWNATALGLKGGASALLRKNRRDRAGRSSASEFVVMLSVKLPGDLDDWRITWQ